MSVPNVLDSFLNKGLDKKSVFSLSENYSSNNIKELGTFKCSVCLYYYVKGLRPNNCNHFFCEKCINIWTKIKKECPYCRNKYSYLISNDC